MTLKVEVKNRPLPYRHPVERQPENLVFKFQKKLQ
jgi:hypothetical protein